MSVIKERIMQKRRQFLGWAGALTIGLIAGCSAPASNGTGADNASGIASSNAGGSGGPVEVKKATIGYLPNIVIPQPLIGLQEGTFAKSIPGVEFAGKDYPAGPAVMEALRSGVVDIAYTGPYPPLKGFIKDRDIVLLAAGGTGGTELLVSQNSPIKSVADLKGKVIGVNQLGSTVDAMVRHKLIEAKITPDKDVKIIEVRPGEQAEALKGGEVQAVAAPAPWPSVVTVAGGRPLLNWKDILDNGKYLQGVAFTTTRFAQANPNFVKAFVEAHKKITDDLNADRAKGDARVLAAWEKVSKKSLKPEVAKAAFGTIEFTNESTLQDWERVQEIAAEVGILRKKGDLTGFLYQPQ
jgi:NitT/TauT family transport system substrate-binding protein